MDNGQIISLVAMVVLIVGQAIVSHIKSRRAEATRARQHQQRLHTPKSTPTPATGKFGKNKSPDVRHGLYTSAEPCSESDDTDNPFTDIFETDGKNDSGPDTSGVTSAASADMDFNDSAFLRKAIILNEILQRKY